MSARWLSFDEWRRDRPSRGRATRCALRQKTSSALHEQLPHERQRFSRYPIGQFIVYGYFFNWRAGWGWFPRAGHATGRAGVVVSVAPRLESGWPLVPDAGARVPAGWVQLSLKGKFTWLAQVFVPMKRSRRSGLESLPDQGAGHPIPSGIECLKLPTRLRFCTTIGEHQARPGPAGKLLTGAQSADPTETRAEQIRQRGVAHSGRLRAAQSDSTAGYRVARVSVCFFAPSP